MYSYFQKCGESLISMSQRFLLCFFIGGYITWCYEKGSPQKVILSPAFYLRVNAKAIAVWSNSNFEKGWQLLARIVSLWGGSNGHRNGKLIGNNMSWNFRLANNRKSLMSAFKWWCWTCNVDFHVLFCLLLYRYRQPKFQF